MLFPYNNLEGANVIAEKIRNKVERSDFEKEGFTRQVTISIGISPYQTQSPSTAADLVKFADHVLYKAKEEGRNQVWIYIEI